jgi:hypothetical protein
MDPPRLKDRSMHQTQMDFSSDFKLGLYNTVHHDENVGPSLRIENRQMSGQGNGYSTSCISKPSLKISSTTFRRGCGKYFDGIIS